MHEITCPDCFILNGLERKKKKAFELIKSTHDLCNSKYSCNLAFANNVHRQYEKKFSFFL